MALCAQSSTAKMIAASLVLLAALTHGQSSPLPGTAENEAYHRIVSELTKQPSQPSGRVVYVAGDVKKPGVYSLGKGMDVSAAVRKAAGPWTGEKIRTEGREVSILRISVKRPGKNGEVENLFECRSLWTQTKNLGAVGCD